MDRPFDSIVRASLGDQKSCSKIAIWMRQLFQQELQVDSFYNETHHLHTELLQEPNNSSSNDNSNNHHLTDPRKSQLPILSFLVSQPASSNLVLNIWTNTRADYEQPPIWLSTLLNHDKYKHRIQLRLFEREIDSSSDSTTTTLLPLPMSSDTTTTTTTTTSTSSILREAISNVQHAASSSDIRRYLALYKYGGIWFDTDTIFIADVRPLLGIDFVSLTQEEFWNNAVVGTSSRRSAFMWKTLQLCAQLYQQNPHHKDYFRYGTNLFRLMRKDTSSHQPKMSFRILPGCLVDSAW